MIHSIFENTYLLTGLPSYSAYGLLALFLFISSILIFGVPKLLLLSNRIRNVATISIPLIVGLFSLYKPVSPGKDIRFEAHYGYLDVSNLMLVIYFVGLHLLFVLSQYYVSSPNMLMRKWLLTIPLYIIGLLFLTIFVAEYSPFIFDSRPEWLFITPSIVFPILFIPLKDLLSKKMRIWAICYLSCLLCMSLIYIYLEFMYAEYGFKDVSRKP
jgi:hypothetical protein